MRLAVGPLALFLVAGACGAASAQSTGIAKCDQYYAMASACLPRMCEMERPLAEAELSFSRETLQKVIELKGRDAAAQACTTDLADAIKDDPYGCYESERANAGLPAPLLRGLKVQPAPSSVTVSFDAVQGAAGDWELALLSEDLEPQVRYRFARSPAGFVLNTAAATPSDAPQPFNLEPGVPYCFAISSPDGRVRRGQFTTSSAR
jgi:hypothetical protein